jgi:hypothetical protein
MNLSRHDNIDDLINVINLGVRIDHTSSIHDNAEQFWQDRFDLWGGHIGDRLTIPIWGEEVIGNLFMSVQNEIEVTEAGTYMRIMSFLGGLNMWLMKTRGVLIRLLAPNNELIGNLLNRYGHLRSEWVAYSTLTQWYYVVSNLFHSAEGYVMYITTKGFYPNPAIDYLGVLLNRKLVDARPWKEFVSDLALQDHIETRLQAWTSLSLSETMEIEIPLDPAFTFTG